MIVVIYILKMLSCSAVLTAYYYFFLRNRTFHQYNRFFLILIFLSSLLLPFVRLPFFAKGSNEAIPVLSSISPERLPEVVLIFNRQTNLEDMLMPNLVFGIYAVIALILFYRMLHSFIYILRLRKQFRHEVIGKIKMFFTNAPGTPFSFFTWIFWNDQLDTNSVTGRRVLKHELYHVKENHSLDMLFVESVLAICWFNPFFYFLKKELKAVHEFLADKAAFEGTNGNEYAELLLMHAIAGKKQQLVHPFFHNQIKRRIIMITQINKTRFAFVRRAMSIPLMFVVCFACSRGIDDVNEKHAEATLSKDQGRPAQAMIKSDTIKITVAKLEEMFAANASTLNISANNAGDFTYMTFDSGPVYSIPTSDIQALADRTGGKSRVSTDKRKDLTDYDQTFTKVEISPEYPGGAHGWMRFLNKTFRYPDEAVEKEIQGTVVLQFIVEKDGSLSAIEALSGPDVLKAEALRVIKQSEKWRPAMQNGVVVKAYHKQPITFRLQSE
jgi:TonB family protein